MLIEKDGCVFDEEQFELSHGYENLDQIGKEAFINHFHLDGPGRLEESEEIIQKWSKEMKEKWPGKIFKIYRQIESDEITIRFHLVRENQSNWCDSGVEIIEIQA